MIAPRNVVRSQPMRPGFTIHGPESNAGANGLIAFASEKINQLSSHTFVVGGARRDEERNIDQATVRRVFSDGVDAEAFDVSFGVARNDDLLSFADCRGATFGQVVRTTKLPPLIRPGSRLGSKDRPYQSFQDRDRFDKVAWIHFSAHYVHYMHKTTRDERLDCCRRPFARALE